MSSEANRAALEPIPSFLAGRFRFVPTADRSVVETIRCGVLFVMAFWSAPSFQSFALLKKAIEASDPEGRLELVVVDADGCPDLHESPDFYGMCNGWGEAAWVCDGRVKQTSGVGYHPEVFEQFTKELLDACGYQRN